MKLKYSVVFLFRIHQSKLQRWNEITLHSSFIGQETLFKLPLTSLNPNIKLENKVNSSLAFVAILYSINYLM